MSFKGRPWGVGAGAGAGAGVGWRVTEPRKAPDRRGLRRDRVKCVKRPIRGATEVVVNF